MSHFAERTVLGVDLGGTKVNVGRVEAGNLVDSRKLPVPVTDNPEHVIETICTAIDMVFDDRVSAIGVGVPSIVDIEKGIVFDVQNIPSWKEIYLKDILEQKYDVSVHLNNDANCFAVGEKYFGQGQSHSNFVALIVGTGMAAGILINDKLYSGASCGAGEFGMLPYLDHYFEYYSSGQFFTNFHNTNGYKVFEMAKSGDEVALKMYADFGVHLGNAVKAILYAIDPPLIIMGGSVSQAYPYFKETLWQQINTLAFRPAPANLKIEISSNMNIAVLGAAALCFDVDEIYLK